MRLCTVPKCTAPLRSRGMCSSHWNRWRRYGDPEIYHQLPRSLTEEERFWIQVTKPDDNPDTCWTWNGWCNDRGYGQYSRLNRKHELAHRMSYRLAFGEDSVGSSQVCHKCDNPPCIRPSHLFLCTQIQNIHDMIAKGRNFPPPHPRGDAHSATRISDAQVAVIRQRAAAGESYRTLAKEYGISITHSHRIVRGLSRK